MYIVYQENICNRGECIDIIANNEVDAFDIGRLCEKILRSEMIFLNPGVGIRIPLSTTPIEALDNKKSNLKEEYERIGSDAFDKKYPYLE